MGGYLSGTQRIEAGAIKAVAVTPNGGVDLPNGFTKGLYVGVSGDVTVTMQGGGTIKFVNLASGIIHPISVIRVSTTGTTATSIVAVY